jgi:hypothetical protein
MQLQVSNKGKYSLRGIYSLLICLRNSKTQGSMYWRHCVSLSYEFGMGVVCLSVCLYCPFQWPSN